MQWPWSKAEGELDREIRHHLESLAEAYQRDGTTRDEAMRRARKDFGGVDQAKEECRDVRRWAGLSQLAQDLRFGARMMRKSQAITAAAVISLALGIGATTAIVSLVDVLLWRTLPVPAPEQLGELFWEVRKQPEGLIGSSMGSNFRDGAVGVADYFSRSALGAMRERTAGKAQIAAHAFPNAVSASFGDAVVVARLRGVTGNFFSMLQLAAAGGTAVGGFRR